MMRYNYVIGEKTMDYTRTILDNSVTVDGIYTVHYFEYVKDFAYSGEFHDFWEIVYADRKSLVLTAGAKEVRLEAGQMYIHKPNEFHNIRPDYKSVANSVIISFDSESPALMGIAGNVITCSNDEKRLIGGIIREAGSAFSTPLGKPYTAVMEKSEDAQFGALQMIRIYLEQLLIQLIRECGRTVSHKRTENSKLLIDICDWLEKNIDKQLRFTDILRQFNTSASVVKKAFHEQMDCGAMEYFTRLKVDAAKQMIRENDLNFTEIADRLSFNTSQYFTTVFRRVTGMTPTEYSFSVKSNFDEGEIKNDR